MIQSAFDISDNTLKSIVMRFLVSMHKQTNVLNIIGNVRSDEGEVIKGTCKTPVKREISHRLAIKSTKKWTWCRRV